MTSFDAQPVLSDPLVLLRPLHDRDWQALSSVAADSAIWALHPANDRWKEPVFRAFFTDAMASGGALAVIDRATGSIIGSSRFDPRRAEPGEIEIGWTFLARSHWGGNTNRAIKRLMIGHALAHHEATIFLIGQHNLRSRRAIEKIGGALTDRTYEPAPATGQGTHVIYAIDRTNFANGPLTERMTAEPAI